MDWLILYRRLKFLPLTMLAVLVVFFVRVESAQVNAKKGLFVTTSAAQAEEKKEVHKEESKKEEKKDEHKEETKKEDSKDEHKEADAKDAKDSEHKEGDKDAHAEEKKEGPIDPLDVSKQEDRTSSELAILQQLADRRRAIEVREAAVMEKEALLKAGEAQFDAKIKELTALRDEIKKLVDATKTKEDEETKRLVTIYEKMKPKEAAGIFNTLNINILLPIVSGMKETKLSPILASMSPDKARQVTDSLAKKSQILPQDAPVRAAAEAAATEALPDLPPPPAQ